MYMYSFSGADAAWATRIDSLLARGSSWRDGLPQAAVVRVGLANPYRNPDPSPNPSLNLSSTLALT